VDGTVDEQPTLPPDLAPYAEPAEPIAPDGQQPLAPGNSTPNGDPALPQTQPPPGDALPWAEPSPPSPESDWQTTPAPESFSSPTESFTNSPDRTPMRSTSPSETSPDSAPNPFGAPAYEGGGPFPPAAPGTSSPTPQDALDNTLSNAGSEQSQSDRQEINDRTEENTNPDSLPNVALMAPNVW
jgi:hypothetical protein